MTDYSEEEGLRGGRVLCWNLLIITRRWLMRLTCSQMGFLWDNSVKGNVVGISMGQPWDLLSVMNSSWMWWDMDCGSLFKMSSRILCARVARKRLRRRKRRRGERSTDLLDRRSLALVFASKDGRRRGVNCGGRCFHDRN